MAKKTLRKDSSKGPNKSAQANQPEVRPSEPNKSVGRMDHRVPIQLLVDYKAEGHFLFDFCRDLGSGGVFIETNRPLSAGSEIDLTFTIPDSKETLRTKAKVIWSQCPIQGRNDVNVGMGVQFTQFSDTERRKLDEFVTRYATGQASSINNRRVG
jgi:type IV pilus assembly protein PilZ